MQNDLLVLEASTITAGFKILNSLTNVKLLDAEPVAAGRFLILAEGKKADLRTVSTKENFEVIEAIDQQVLDAVFSLASNKLDESLVVLETETAPAMFAHAQNFVREHSLRALEIKIRKSGVAGSFAFFTGTKQACEAAAAGVRAKFASKMQQGSVEVLDQPNAHVRSLFES